MAISPPRVVIGLPVYEPGEALSEAVSDLLQQSYPSYALLLMDDASADPATRAVLARCARHPRVTVRRNDRRLGLAGNWQATLLAARELHPQAELFAWAGHHDAWHEDWLAAMVARLDANPRAVLAYPWDARMGPDGRTADHASPPFATAGEADPVRRLSACARGVCAGSAIYGLVRVGALVRAEGFDRVLRPDRLTLAKLALLGEFEQEPRVLWRRRMTGRPTARRQREASFPDSGSPAAYLPWPIVHATLLWRWLVRCRPRPLPRRRIRLIVCTYVGLTLKRDASQWALERAFSLEGRLPRGMTAPLRHALGFSPRQEPEWQEEINRRRTAIR